MGLTANLLAFDSSSTTTGWALMGVPLSPGGKIKLKKFGHFKIRTARTKKKKRIPIPIPKRLVDFADTIEALIRDLKPAYIAFEEHHIAKASAAKTILKFMGVALEIAYRYTEKEVIEIGSRKIRTELGITWMGRDIAKAMVKTEVEKFFGIEVEIEDESDAIALGMVSASRVKILEGRK
jgi:Holliday junction resolvasome RuvABC endonuclease subunit